MDSNFYSAPQVNLSGVTTGTGAWLAVNACPDGFTVAAEYGPSASAGVVTIEGSMSNTATTGSYLDSIAFNDTSFIRWFTVQVQFVRTRVTTNVVDDVLTTRING